MSLQDRRSDSAVYEAWYHRPPGLWAAGLQARLLLKLAGPVAGLRVLDAGCGTGYFTRLLLAQGARACGLDRDLGRLRLARHLALRQGLTAPFIGGDILHLPFRSGSFHLVVMVTVLEFLKGRELAVAEVARVLCPRGRVVVLALTSRGLWGLGRKLRPRLPYTVMSPVDPAELRALLSAIGPVHTEGLLYAPP